ncbi:hypothetical protein BDZ90DRAFT_234645 [Jaminaea rosea]|uniref:Uncharacterized protein n=1 Tax=Jaminaea rosea TaxID=1569628 RepID=A0A316UHG8_9BASI|nr:hypothetical protein BDZ90DRAFT_234645 [Jaminaea rosea]PWN24679.1 hypothetical protein BDZ90DRAFT_234645 [Jaminaea rosea]
MAAQHAQRRPLSPGVDLLASSPSSQTPSLLEDPGLSDISSLDGEDFELIDRDDGSETSSRGDDDTRMTAPNATQSWLSGTATPGRDNAVAAATAATSPSVNRLRQSYLGESTLSMEEVETPTTQSAVLDAATTTPPRLTDMTQSSFSFPDPNSPPSQGLSPVESRDSRDSPHYHGGSSAAGQAGQDFAAATTAPEREFHDKYATADVDFGVHGKILHWLSQSTRRGENEEQDAGPSSRTASHHSDAPKNRLRNMALLFVVVGWLFAVVGLGSALWLVTPALPLMAARSLSALGLPNLQGTAREFSSSSSSSSSTPPANTPLASFPRIAKADWSSTKAIAVKPPAATPRTTATDVALVVKNLSTDVALYHQYVDVVLSKPRALLQQQSSKRGKWVEDGFAFLKYGKDRVQAEARDEWAYWQAKLEALWLHVVRPFLESLYADAKRQHARAAAKWEDIKRQHGPAYEEMRRATQLHMRRAAVGSAVLYARVCESSVARDLTQKHKELIEEPVRRWAQDAARGARDLSQKRKERIEEPVRKWFQDAARGAEVVFTRGHKRRRRSELTEEKVRERVATWKKRLEAQRGRAKEKREREQAKRQKKRGPGMGRRAAAKWA